MPGLGAPGSGGAKDTLTRGVPILLSPANFILLSPRIYTDLLPRSDSEYHTPLTTTLSKVDFYFLVHKHFDKNNERRIFRSMHTMYATDTTYLRWFLLVILGKPRSRYGA